MVGVDEIPTFQIMVRHPIRRAIPGSIQQQEVDYTRHGTVNLLVFLVVHTGLLGLVFLARNDQEHSLPELQRFHRQFKDSHSVFLSQDGGESHIAAGTQEYSARRQGWWKPGMSPRVLTSDNMILDLAKKGELTATTTALIVNATVVSTP